MKEFSLKKAIYIFLNEIKISKKTIIYWGIALFGICLMYMGLFPSVKEMMSANFENFPEEILELIGMGSIAEMRNYNTYFASILNVLILVLTIYTSFSACNLLYDEEENLTIDFVYSCNVSRADIYFGKMLYSVVKCLFFMLIVIITSVLVGLMVANEEVKVLSILLVGIISFLTVLFFSSFGFLLVGIFKKSIKSPSICISVMFLTYLMGYASKIGPSSLRFLKWISPLDLLNSVLLMKSNIGVDGNTNLNFFPILAIFILICVFYGMGYFFYRKKDL